MAKQTFERNKPHLRTGSRRNFRPATGNRQSMPQMQQRARFGSLMSSWRKLTPEEQATWTVAAPYFKFTKGGHSYQYTGAQLYSRVNMRLLSNDLPTITKIGASPLPMTIGGVTERSQDPHPWEVVGKEIDENTALMGIEAVDGELQADEYIEVFATAPVSAGMQLPRSAAFKRIGIYQEADITWAAELGTIPVGADYTAVFGLAPVAAGANVVFLETWIFNGTQGFAMPYGTIRVTMIDQP